MARIEGLYNEDCRKTMERMDDNSVDSIVTDAPYGLKFMGKKWDNEVPSVDIWKECFRVLKPGGHLLAFAGTRTQHRMCINIEDAGFEIRDMLAWIYGNGFTKSFNISKAVDKVGPNVGQKKVLYEKWGRFYASYRKKSGLTHSEISEKLKAHGKYNHGGTSYNWEKGLSVPSDDQLHNLGRILNFDSDKMHWPKHIRDEYLRDIIGIRTKTESFKHKGNNTYKTNGNETIKKLYISKPKSEKAKQWDGWGTALKPALEPITLARKPLSESTVAGNILKWGTGGLNIDASRIPGQPHHNYGRTSSKSMFRNEGSDESVNTPELGRFPSNLIHDGSEEVEAIFPYSKSGSRTEEQAKNGGYKGTLNVFGSAKSGGKGDYFASSGSASRFFYCARAEKKDRGEYNNHPTVKPTKLMQYLVRLVTPPDGLVYDPFTGSGSTWKAIKMLGGFRFIGSELEKESCLIAERRIFDLGITW